MSLSIKGSPLYGSYQRVVNKPVDTTAVWATYTLAAEYADNNGTDDYCPYDGQIVVTLQGYPDVTDVNSEKYKTAHVWRLKKDGPDTTVNGLTRQHFVLEEVKAGTEVAGTNEHNTFTGTQTFESWIELLGGMTMGYKLAKKKDEAGNPIIKTDSITGKPLYIDGEGNERVLTDDMERIWLDGQGKGHMVISALKVLGTLEVSEIDVNHIKHSGGLFVNSRANIIVDSVEQLSGDRTKLTFVGQANGQTLFNLFEVGDLALSMTFNVLKEGASTPSEGKVVRWYWREVVAVDDTSITLAPQDASLPEMATPRKGDTVVQVGHVDAPEDAADDKKAHVASRQGLQVMGFSDTNGPFIAEYSGIKAPSASISFDEPSKAIVYLSPKYHKLQGNKILLKATNEQGSTDVTLTADTIKTITQNLSVVANILDIQAGNVSATINGLDGRIAANAKNIALKADNKWLLKMTKDSAGMYVIGEDGLPLANGGRMILVANTDGSIGAVTIANNGQMVYTGDFTLKARNVDFTAGAINMNTAKFTIGQQENVTLFENGKIKTAYIDVNTLKAKLIEAGIINAAEIVTDALTSASSFNAQGAKIANLKVTGNSIFQGHLDGVDGTFSGNLDAAGGTFQGSVSIAGGKVLIDGNEVNGATSDAVQMHIGVNGLIAKAVNAQNRYLLANTDGIEMRWISDGLRLSQKGLERYDGSKWVNMFSEEKARTIDGETTLDVKDGIVVCTKMESHYTVTLPPTSTELVNGKTIQIIATDTTANHYIVVKPNSNQQITTSAAGNNENGGRKLLHANRCWVTYLNNFWHFSATGGSDA